MLTFLLGGMGATISFIMFLPSLLSLWANRHDAHAMRAASVGTNLLILLNATVWGLYAILTSAFWVGAPGLVNGPVAILSIVLILRARRDFTAETILVDNLPETAYLIVAEEPSEGGEAHGILVVEPEGSEEDTKA